MHTPWQLVCNFAYLSILTVQIHTRQNILLLRTFSSCTCSYVFIQLWETNLLWN